MTHTTLVLMTHTTLVLMTPLVLVKTTIYCIANLFDSISTRAWQTSRSGGITC